MHIGVIGVGAMGAGIATRLLNQNYQVQVRDIVDEREQRMHSAGATIATQPASMIASVDAVFIVVVTAAQIDQVLNGDDGLLTGLTQTDAAQKTVFLCSTIAPEDTERFAELISATQARVIDAPISGGPARAYDGSMSMMIAATDEHVAPVAELINAVAQRQFRVSQRCGDGARAKLVNNLAAGVNLTVAAEAIAMAGKLGLDKVKMQALMAASSAQSWAADDRIPRALVDDFEPRAATRVLMKDLTLGTELAARCGASVPLGQQALAQFVAACESGLAELDDAAMLTYYENKNS
jgi:3-hydroxyisobutyrate dehydrogenase